MLSKEISVVLALFLILLVVPANAVIAASLAWDAPQGDVTGYRIYYSAIQGSFNNFKDVGNVTTYSLDQLPLQEMLLYYLTVTAYNSAGESAYSNIVTWTPQDATPPAPPQGLTAE